MKIGNITLQLSGIDLACLTEKDIMEKIKVDCEVKGLTESEIGEINVYINVEGTAVTAYYVCENGSGAIRLN